MDMRWHPSTHLAKTRPTTPSPRSSSGGFGSINSRFRACSSTESSCVHYSHANVQDAWAMLACRWSCRGLRSRAPRKWRTGTAGMCRRCARFSTRTRPRRGSQALNSKSGDKVLQVSISHIYIFVYKYVVCVSVSSMEYLLDIYNNDISDIMIPMMYSM